MVHCYKLGGLNIVLDICSGSVHVVDDVVYDIIEAYESRNKEEIIDFILEKYATEADLEHYISTVEDDEITVKKYYSNAKDGSSSNTSNEKKEDAEEVSRWATFFYIFSSLLLALVIGMALVAVFVKKHPVKHRVKATNDHEKDIELLKPKKSDIFEPTSKSSNEAFARTAVAGFAAQLDPNLEELGDIRTAVSEAVTNCIVHAYPDSIGLITVRCRILKDKV